MGKRWVLSARNKRKMYKKAEGSQLQIKLKRKVGCIIHLFPEPNENY